MPENERTAEANLLQAEKRLIGSAEVQKTEKKRAKPEKQKGTRTWLKPAKQKETRTWAKPEKAGKIE